MLDSIARAFSADLGFSAGTVGTNSFDFGNAGDNALFDSYRRGSTVSFHTPIVNGHYALFLEFADTQSTAAGQRVMNVSVEGQTALSGLDVFAAAGANTPTAREINTTVSDGTLDVNLTATTGEAFVNAIVAVPTDVPVNAEPYSWEAAGPDDSRKVYSASAMVSIGRQIYLYQTSNHGKNPPDFAALTASLDSGNYISYASPRTDTRLPRGELSLREQAAWAGASKDFLYVGASLKSSSPPSAVVAYENPQRVAGGLNVLYADGHVGFLDRATAASLLNFDANAPLTGGAPLQTTQMADARFSASAQNLRNIAVKMLLYANEHRGRYPLLPGDLVDDSADPAWFVDPRGNSPLPPAGTTGDAAKAFINAQTDYRYVAGDASDSGPSDQVLMYETPSANSDGLIFLMADGSTRYEENRWAAETLRRTVQSFGTTAPLAEIAKPDPLLPGTSATLNGAGVAAYRNINNVLTAPAIATYQWDFNYNGNPANFNVAASGATPTFTAPASAGTRTIALRVIDSTGAVSAITTVPIAILPISLSTGAAYTLTHSAFTLTSGTAMVASDVSTVLPNLNLSATGSAVLTLNATQHINQLVLADSARAGIPIGGSKVLTVQSLTMSPTARLDLGDNSLIIDYGNASPAATVRSLLSSGRNGGTWNGTSGITSSAVAGVANSALGYGEASSILGPNGGTFAGQTVDGTALIVRFTLIGDVNLDRKVDIGDLGLLAQNWQKTNAVWSQGDFDYSGLVDIGDLGLLSQDWQRSYAPPAAAAVVAKKAAVILPIKVAARKSALVLR